MNDHSITIVCVATTNQEASLAALIYSKRIFPVKQTLFVSDMISLETICGKNDVLFHYTTPFSSVVEWGQYIVFDLYKLITTSHIILIHADGFIININKWNQKFLYYDYVGAPWPFPNDSYTYRDINNNLSRVGNSVSLRSLLLLELPTKLHLEWSGDLLNFHGHEDGFLCVHQKHVLEQNGCNFAPIKLAASFSREVFTKYHFQNLVPFAFHRWNLFNFTFPRSNKNGTITYFFDIFSLFPILDIFDE